MDSNATFATEAGAKKPSFAEKFVGLFDKRTSPFSSGEILRLERMVLTRSTGEIDPNLTSDEHSFRNTAQEFKATALCLSGGGIRSASFALGVTQALAAKRLLTSFDYLSTVSGGGYLGGFLQRWLLGDVRDGRNEIGLQEVLAKSVEGNTLPEIDRLRDGSNFITPQLGLFSSDSWVVVATSLRNVFVNWLLFAPLFMILAALPVALYWTLMAASQAEAQIALVIHFLALAWAMATVGVGLPTYRRGGFLTPREITGNIVVPVFVAAIATLVMAAGPPLADPPFAADPEIWKMWPSAVSATIAPLAGLLGTVVFCMRSRAIAGGRVLADLLLWSFCGILAALTYFLVSTYLVGTDDRIVWNNEGGTVGAEYLIIGGPALFVAAILLAGWIFSLFRGVLRRSPNLKSDFDREWLVRLSALLLKPTLAWAALATVALIIVYYDPETGTFSTSDTEGSLLSFDKGAALISSGFASGLIGAFAGKSGSTWIGYVRKFLSLELVAMTATVLFCILALTVGGLVVNDLIGRGHDLVTTSPFAGWFEPHWYMALACLGLIVALAAFVAVFGRVVDVNRFSLNGFYRNRLARAFLGAARCGPLLPGDANIDVRRADPFTGFDPEDNVRLHTLWPSFRSKDRRPALFPVINVALNAVATKRLAWQERKALPFVLTPLVCGSGWLGPAGAYVISNRYGGQERDQALEGNGVTLAAAMAISGAAASPNMGYHSSPSTAFLMTLFNVRLGAWLPNPALWKPGSDDNPVEKQRNAAGLLLRELVGRTEDSKPDVYLSDGGHFENLGLYEMIRRRCAYIVVVDTGCDPGFGFEDLGNALRKISIDFNVDITFSDFNVRAKGETGRPRFAHAVGTIDYPEGWQGKLLYLKPTLTDDLPLDVRAYSTAHGSFPHETTADQWYTESQFESYRRLGQHLVETIGATTYESFSEGPDRLSSFILAAEAALSPTRAHGGTVGPPCPDRA